jgi:hypothetical protein
VTKPSGSGVPLFGVTYGAGLFIAVGGDCYEDTEEHRRCFSTLLTSTEGTNWHEQFVDFPFLTRLHSVAYGQGRFVTVGQNVIAGSTNGSTWTAATITNFQYFKSVAYGNGTFVVVGEDGRFFHSSTNGLNWTVHDCGVLGPFDEVSFGNGIFIAVGDNGTILSSTDGEQWARRRSPVRNNLRGITYGNGTFVIVGNNDAILQSASFEPGELRISHGPGLFGRSLSIEGEIGRRYRLQTTPQLPASSWTDLLSVTLVNLRTNIADLPVLRQRFYRLVSP